MQIPRIKRIVLLAIICSPLTLASCDEDATPVENDPPPKIEERKIRDLDFVKRRFFFLDYPSSGTFTPPLAGMVELYRSVPLP
ncbi:MAG: hypothetical protein H6Q78_1406, partial [Candidatus Krumholzibacteriota bacterium]|nr:hypothetical protein [Candidatus Krumholzibacteriota bacterium]